MKKRLAAILAVLMLAGCASETSSSEGQSSESAAPSSAVISIYDPDANSWSSSPLPGGGSEPRELVEAVGEALGMEITLNSVYLDDSGTAIVDFKADSRPVIGVGSMEEDCALSSIAQTLLDNGARQVVFRVDGGGYSSGHYEFGADEPYAPAPSETPAQQDSFDDVAAEMSDSEKSWMNMSQEQYLEDFDYLYAQLQENYPFFHVAKRKKNIDIDALYAEYRDKIARCSNDYDFHSTATLFVSELDYTGHIDMWGTRFLSAADDMRAFIDEFPEYAERYAPYLEKLDNPVSEKNYSGFAALVDSIDREVQRRNASIATEDEQEDGGESGGDTYENVRTDILKEGETAYVWIGAFDMARYNEDKQTLLNFYKQVAGYHNLIIDIRDNGGGGMPYFDDLVVAPLIDKTLAASTYCLVKGGENNRYFLQIDEGMQTGKWRPVSGLPALPQMNAEDLREMAYFQQEDYTVEPLEDGQKGFSGKIWLLVGPGNYSSSEYAAMFSKQTGFATLVGETTGGDGIGTDPVYIIMPNSGFAVQYSPVYGVTPDGRNSEEFGTEPDIICSNGEDALTACLRAIDEESRGNT